jgi:hypothetical protein
MEQHSQVQVKNTQFNTIWEGISDIDRWITENLNAPVEILCPSSIDKKVDLSSLDPSNKLSRENIERQPTQWKFVHDCTRWHNTLTRKCHLPPLEELGKTLIMVTI